QVSISGPHPRRGACGHPTVTTAPMTTVKVSTCPDVDLRSLGRRSARVSLRARVAELIDEIILFRIVVNPGEGIEKLEPVLVMSFLMRNSVREQVCVLAPELVAQLNVVAH